MPVPRCSKLAGTRDASSSRCLLRSSLAAHPLLSFGTRIDNLKGLLFGFALLNVDSSIRVDSVTLWQRLRATDDRAASSPRVALIWLVSGRATGGTAERRADGGFRRDLRRKSGQLESGAMRVGSLGHCALQYPC